jgi:hypothetical protein
LSNPISPTHFISSQSAAPDQSQSSIPLTNTTSQIPAYFPCLQNTSRITSLVKLHQTASNQLSSVYKVGERKTHKSLSAAMKSARAKILLLIALVLIVNGATRSLQKRAVNDNDLTESEDDSDEESEEFTTLAWRRPMSDDEDSDESEKKDDSDDDDDDDDDDGE